MMIKITERCTMGCKHCMNSAKPDGRDMSIEVLEDTLNFMKKHLLGQNLIITGGEPLEHRDFPAMMGYIAGWNMRHDKYIKLITITTNGEHILDAPEAYVEYVKAFAACGITLMFQISADVRYYPRRIPTHKRIFREPGFILCDNCVEQIYPQGRAKENNIPWQSKASKCFNVRSIVKQLGDKCTLVSIENILMMHGKMCTPHIKVDGSIGLGESDLCPSCSSIYDTEKEILDKIRQFRCHGCDIVNNTLLESLKKLIE